MPRKISIHTTRVGGDPDSFTTVNPLLDFNPHHPCGWWLPVVTRLPCSLQFQSTPPVWVVTLDNLEYVVLPSYFNPHHPCGWWRIDSPNGSNSDIFQSTPPVWVVTGDGVFHSCINLISIHTTRVGGDLFNFIKCKKITFISIHTTRVGGDVFLAVDSVKLRRISIHTTRVGGDL